ncbi:MAG: CotH kinase family protein [Melioribacteraceae bacterium]
MKNKFYFIFAFLITTIIFQDQNFAQSFYDLNTVQTIEVVFKQSNWDYLLDTAKAGSESYLMAESVTINGVRYDSVGVKYKGNSTYNPNQMKNPFHIELDTYKEQDYQGYSDIKLSNVAKDPSFVREVLSYSILRNYMNAPLSNYANVYVNGNLIGLFVNSESIGKKFVKSNFYSKDKAFFKCNPIDGAGMGTTDIPNLLYLGDDSLSYSKAYEIKSDYGWKDLINLCYVLNNDVSNIETVLDVDRALWMLAFDNVLVNLDSYLGEFSQNYYLYKDNTGRFNCVLWDFNESFGTFSQSGTINFMNNASKSQMTHLLHVNDAKWPLVKQLLSIPTYKKMYLAHMNTILTENFSDGSYLITAESIQPIINSSVQADPYKFFTYTQYQNNLTADVSFGPGPPGSGVPGISILMDARANYLLSLADFTASKPSIINVAASEDIPKLNSTIFITATVTGANNDEVFLGYRANIEDKFAKSLMYDDGLHGDGAAGDNLFGASILVSDNMQYYIYAENNNAGIFSPVRAEHEFYSLKANDSEMSSNIVMNEIYSRGTSTDPDWIEIYNGSTSVIDLSNYKIYDSGGQSGSKEKKGFPSGTMIEPKGFYVIVTDGSESSDFGLSNNGEEVWLEDETGSVIDDVTFPVLAAGESYGRVPDGNEAFKILTVQSRGASNGTETSVDSDSYLPITYSLYQNFPNPFNPSTEITFSVPESGNYTLTVFNILGQKVATLLNDYISLGIHSYKFNAFNLPSGTYFYNLRGNNFNQTKKMLLMK